jgi:hypothetical protein
VLARDEVSQMIKDAEENALFDKSKKSIVNISYELDNLLSKADILFEKQIISENSVASSYLSELLKESKELYKLNNLTKLSLDCIKNFKYIYSILVLEFVKKNLMSSNSSNSSKNASDNIIDVELADES